MPKFAVYYNPPAASPADPLGSGQLGDDIRAGAALPHNNPARDRLTGFDPAWVDRAAEYGFHVTVAGTYTCDPADLDAVRAGVAAVMDCFNPAHAFTLRPMALEWWGDPAAVLLVCTPNSHFQMLHTALCAYLPRWGTGSRGFDRLARDSGYLADQSHAQRRIRHFYTAYIFDEFMPHFTLLNPYPGGDRDRLRAEIRAPMDEIVIESLCLVYQAEDGAPYRIIHEYHRADHPGAGER